MALSAGTRLGPYEILEPLGAGGMGEVYRARDSRLGRDVAVKVLPEELAGDPQRLARLRGEARTLATLNHPGIATLHEIGDEDGTSFLVMELVEGPTLAERIRRGALPLPEALELGRQIAAALEAAHEKAIIHRDLKPANVKLTKEGRVKLLDFGLAKVSASGAVDSEGPTATREGTAAGTVLGTAAYMSPEQARGQKLDRRTDVWSFGCVLYEMLTGRRPFQASTISDTLAGVLEHEPDWDALPETTPALVRSLLRRCLQKDQAQRLHDIADARIEIGEALAEPPATPVVGGPRPAFAARGILFSVAVAAFLAVLVFQVGLWNLVDSTQHPVVSRLSLHLPSTAMTTGFPYIALSPDGSHLVYSTSREGPLMLRSMSELDASPIAGTEKGRFPFFSPDGGWIGFFADGKLQKVSLEGGAPVVLCDAPDPRGGSWGADGTIVFTPTYASGVWRISATGGASEATTQPNGASGELSHRWPEILPGGESVLITVERPGTFDDASIAVVSLKTNETKPLIDGGSHGRYASTGHLVYMSGGSLLALPFDLGRLETLDTPVPVVDNVAYSWDGGMGSFTYSQSGSLMYLPDIQHGRTVVLVDREGSGETRRLSPRSFSEVSTSPDGSRLATVIRGDIWVWDIARGTLSRLTFKPGAQMRPVWSPDSRWLTFSSSRSGAFQLYRVVADGSGEPERLLESEVDDMPGSWSSDGTQLAFERHQPDSGWDVWMLRLGKGEPEARPVLTASYDETEARLSPRGDWLAYVSNESGRDEVYVQAHAGRSGKRQVSAAGGWGPRWGPNAQELFYRDGITMMVVDISTKGTTPHIGDSRLLFEERYYRGRSLAVPLFDFDVTSDGQEFAMIRLAEEELRDWQLVVVLNWFEELKRRVPVN